MTDDQRLALLDRRAAAATTALDQAVEQVPVPDHDLGTPTQRFRRFLPMAVAAGLVVVALVGAVLILDDDEQATIAGQPDGITRLALPDPESLGYRIVGAFDGSAGVSPVDQLDIPMTVHSPTDSDDPWETTVITYSLPAEMTTLGGEPVDVSGPGGTGGPEAMLDMSNGALTLGWVDGDRVRYMRSAGASAGELVVLASQAVVGALPEGAPLPGHEVIHVAPHTDLLPMMAATVSATASDLGGIAYESDHRGLVVGTTSGSRARWRASYALAVRVERVTVRGRDAVRAEFGNDTLEVSWLEADGTLVRVDSSGGPIPLDVLDHLEPISDADFGALVDEFDREQTVDMPVTTVDDREPLAEVALEENGIRVRSTLLRSASEFEFEIDSETVDGGSGLARTLPDTATNVALRDVFTLGAKTGLLLGGVIGPDVTSIVVIDATSERVLVDGTSTAAIDGSDHIVFLATVSVYYRTRDLVVVGTTLAGEEIRLDAPAQP